MPSLITIVNEEDEIIGHKDRTSLDHETDIYRVAALWLTNSTGEVLIAQRALSKESSPGKWGPAAAGTVEEGETYESNIVKEVEPPKVEVREEEKFDPEKEERKKRVKERYLEKMKDKYNGR